MKRVLKVAGWILASFILLLFAAYLAFVQPGGSGVIASLRLPDGSEYMVTQRCNWGLEPYTVAFYMRAPGDRWGWCYIDHEAMRWRDVVMSYDTTADTIVVTERGTRRAALDRKRSAFWMDNGSSRELAAPQGYQEPEFGFP